MRGRRWLVLVVGIVVLGSATALAWPTLVRHVAIAQVRALTGRPVTIGAVQLNLLTGRLTIRDFRLAERDGTTPFADFAQLDVRMRLPALLRGHLRLREVVLRDSTVRVVRLTTNDFNISDLVQGSGATSKRLDVTVDRFVVSGGTVTLQDQALPEARTWASERIMIEAHDLSTLRGGGRAVGRSVTAGAPVSLDVRDLRLYPIHLAATVTVEGLDVGMARVYFPPGTPVIVDRGRASTSVDVLLDAREGLRIDADGQFEDVAFVKADEQTPLAIVPKLVARVAGFGVRAGELQLEHLAVEGTLSVRDPTGKGEASYRTSSVQARVADLTWPARTAGRLDVQASIPGGGRLTGAGTLRPPPDATQLQVRVVDLDLAPWAQFLPLAARLKGQAQADVRMNEPITAGIPARVKGTITVNGLGVADARQEVISVERIEASELELHWPTQFVVGRLLVSGPRGLVERDSSGRFALAELAARSGASPAVPKTTVAGSARAPRFGVAVDEVVVRDGTVLWRDASVSPPARFDVSNIEATALGSSWQGSLNVPRITLAARKVSTPRHDDGAGGGSASAGALVSVEVNGFQLDPIHLLATASVQGLDLSSVRAYVPPSAPVSVNRGRLSTSAKIGLDARDGLRVDAESQFQDVALVKRDESTPLSLVPRMTAQVTGFGFREGELQLERLAVDGTISVRDPAAQKAGSYRESRVQASIADLTWPARTAGRLDIRTSIPGGGTLTAAGTVRPPPDATQLHVRVADLDLAPWAQFLPLTGKVRGLAEADLQMNEPLGAGIPSHVQGMIAVNELGVADARRELISVKRIEASGLEVHWPSRVVVGRILVSGPHGIVERDRSGRFPLTTLASRPGASDAVPAPAATDSAQTDAMPPIGAEVGEVVVRDGTLAWDDATVSPAAHFGATSIQATVSALRWPQRSPVDVRVGLRPPGGGHLELAGRVSLDPLGADLRVSAKEAELAPYQPYVPIPARIRGAADLDLTVALPSLTEGRATVRGSLGLSRVDVRDAERTVVRLQRAGVKGLTVEWPDRVVVNRLELSQPWVLVERDQNGALPSSALFTPRSDTTLRSSPADAAPAASPPSGRTPLAVTVAELAVDDGGMRVVDHAVSPAFAIDLQSATLRMESISTASASPARIDLAGRIGAAELALRGTIAAFGGPLRLDMSGELREFSIPRTNPYLIRQVGWMTREGRVATKIRCRIDGDTLSAQTDFRLSRLELEPASDHDEAQARIGLPLGLVTGLMKDPRGDINLSFPVGGRLSDPRFDFREAIWSALRTVSINAITLPVSWIGRLQVGDDSRVQRIEVDPIPFEPGTARLTAEGHTRVAAVTSFLQQLPAVKMALTPLISSDDVGRLRRQPLEAAIDDLARTGGLSRQDAVTRLFVERLSGQPVPETSEATFEALLAREPRPTADAVAKLGARRLETVRAPVKQAGVDTARLVDKEAVQRDGSASRIELEVLDPETPRPSKGRELLRRFGVPLKGAEGEGDR